MAGEEAAEQLLGLEAHPVAMAAQESCLFVGRVCCDSEGGRLNPQSLLLEGSMRRSQGARVRLDVGKCPSFRLFPGQVVALRGTNPSGHCVVASQVLAGLAQPLPRSSLATLAGHAAVTGRGGQSVVVAAGPFTSSEDLEYAPLGALLHYCAQPQQRPDLLLLVGPFVDAEHPLVRGGLVEEAFEDIYAARVSEPSLVAYLFLSCLAELAGGCRAGIQRWQGGCLRPDLSPYLPCVPTCCLPAGAGPDPAVQQPGGWAHAGAAGALHSRCAPPPGAAPAAAGRGWG